MPSNIPTIPSGFHSVNAYLTVGDAAQAIAFYQQAFGAEEILRLVDQQGRVAHAEVRIGESIVMLAPEYPELGIHAPPKYGGTPVRLHVYVDDVDRTFARAVAAGAKAMMPPTNQFYGDRSGRLEDPFGHAWLISTHLEDLSPAEMQRRFEALLAEPGSGS